MFENRLKSNILTNNISLTNNQLNKFNALSLTNPIVLSTKTTLNLTTQNVDRKKKLYLPVLDLSAKKAKTIDLTNNLLLTSSLLTPVKSNLENSQIKLTNELKQILLPAKIYESKPLINTFLTNKNEIKQIEVELKPVKRVYSESDLESQSSQNDQEQSFLIDEYLKVDSLIQSLTNDNKIQNLKRFKSIQKNQIIQLSTKITNVHQHKKALINAVSSSLLRQPNFKNKSDATRKQLYHYAEAVIDIDPEFILKLALYTRRELNIRVTANFLISLASFKEMCRPFLQRYFNQSIMLPSDWIDVAEQYQLFTDKKINFGSLPNALRKCMVDKFPKFDQYQLAKYNKEKSRSAKNNILKDIKHVKSKLKDEEGNEKDIIEDKYIKTLTHGLQINDRIQIQIVANSKCDLIKFDIINRENKGTETPATKIKKTQTFNNDYEESVAVRISLDYLNKRILQKSFLKKLWSKRSDVVMAPQGYQFELGFQIIHFYIDITSTEFIFGVIEKEQDIQLCKYSHSKHNIELFKLNIVRISGVDIKLKDLKIESKDQVGWDHQISEESEKENKQRSYTLKQLIRQLHIPKPVSSIMSLLGKKYPASFEEFIQLKLEGEYDSDKANKRMKLPIPETWETQISMFGNKAEIWERLIDNKKLPYMAMLRNLRNMIKSDISDKHHNWVIKKLQDEGAVINSKQFPFRFFTAYEVLDELLDELKNYSKWLLNPEEAVINKKANKGKKQKPKLPSDIKYNEEIIKRYKTALDNALKVATRFNISPIKGSTAIFINLSSNMTENVSRSCKSLGKKVNSIGDIAALMGLMLKYACEHSRLNVFKNETIKKDIELEQGTILDNMKSLTDLIKISCKHSSGTSYPKKCFSEILQDNEHYDNLIILSDGVHDVEYHKSFLRKYRSTINKDLLFVNINLAHDECGLLDTLEFNHENDICIAGYSDSILRFIAERGSQGQLIHIDNIDKSYDLPSIKKQENITETKALKLDKPAMPVPIISHWKTIKVFISSTFKDMHSERDILTKTVFPLLRSRLAQHLINIHEIDMRWGITEHESNTNETLNICLNQIMSSDYFIGILGDRYGMTLNEYRTNHDWVASYPIGASITELEFEAQINKCNQSQDEFNKSFFYFRDNSFIESVPTELKHHFEDENKSKLNELKIKIKSKPFEIYNNYSCKWYKIDEKQGDNRALLTGLEQFAERVYNNLYNSILKHHCEPTKSQENELTKLNNAYIEAFASLFTGRFKLITKLEKLLKETLVHQSTAASTDASKELIKKQNSIINICLCQSEAGAGKTTFLCHYYINHLPRLSPFSFAFSVGSFSSSEFAVTFLKTFCVQILNHNTFFKMDDFDEESNDFNYYKKIFSLILNSFDTSVHSELNKFYILIDSVDMFIDSNNNKDESFNWLPELIPASISFIFSAKSNSQTKYILERIIDSNRLKNNIKLTLFDIETLDVLDKSEIVKSKLNKYNKQLEESSFNNQMKLLTGKREAFNPLYLSLACEELRVHNQYESLNNKIKELPVKANLLIIYVLNRLEKEYGEQFINAVFMFITCSKEGLLEQELYDLLNLYSNVNIEQLDQLDSILEYKNIQLLFQTKKCSTQKYLSLIQTISDTFLKPRSQSGPIALKTHSLIETAILAKYNNKILNCQQTNTIMALYFWHLIDDKFQSDWTLNNQRAYIYLPFHLSFANCYSDLTNLLCDLKFIANKSELGLIAFLMEDYDLNETNIAKNIQNKKTVSANKKIKLTIQSITQTKRFIDYKAFIMTNHHLLQTNPTLIYQQAINQDDDSTPAKDVYELLKSESKISGCLFEWTNKAQTDSKIKPLTIQFNDSICSVVINSDLIACGTENCEIKLYNLNTAALLKTFQGHSGRINQLCFINSGTLVSVSTDGIASIWSVNAGFRIKVINNHNGHVVSGCCAEPSGKTFLTCGWDCNVKIWDSNEGNFLGDLKGHTKPVNCIQFSPDGFQVATAGWDTAIRIYNIVDRARKAVLRSHKTSIRSISYSNNGVFIASSSIDGDVKLWNAKIGSNIASLNGHCLPVNSVKFSPCNQFLITGSSDRRLRVWSGGVGKIVRIIKDDNVAITCVCFNQKNGEYIAAGYHNGELRIYETNTGYLRLKIKIHNKPIKRIKYSSCNDYIISSADDGSVKLNDLKQNAKTKKFSSKQIAEFKGNNKSVNALAINQFNIVITGTEDCILNVYDSFVKNTALDEYLMDFEEDMFKIETIKTNDTNIYPEHSLNTHKSPITACVFNSTGEKFATASKDANIIIWSLNRFNLEINELFNITNAHTDWITDLSWSNSSEFILSSSNDFSLKLWNAETGKESNQMIGHKSNINSCCFQYGCAVSTASDGSVKVWSHKGFEVASLTGHQNRVNSCDLFFKIKTTEQLIEPNDLWADLVDKADWDEAHKKAQLDKKEIKVEQVLLVTVSDDSTIRLWKPNESDWIQSLENHNDKINSIDLSGTDLIASASNDCSVNIYNMKNFFTEYLTGKFVNSDRLVRNHNSEITSIVFCQNRPFMFSSSRDGILIIWRYKYGLNNTLSSIDFVQELQAHDKTINKVCIIKEKKLFNKYSVEFATCSDDKRTNIWTLTEDENEKCLIQLTKTIKEQSVIMSIFTYQTENENVLAIFIVNDLMRVHLKVYDINKSYSPIGNKGFQIIYFKGIVQQVKLTHNYIYITFVHDEIFKLNVKEVFSKFQIFNYENKNDLLQKIILNGDSSDDAINWYSCVDEQNDNTFAADCKGDLYINKNDNQKLELKKQLHSERVTDIISFKSKNNEHRFITSSQDCTVKIWSDQGEYQLGQYNTNTAITAIEQLRSDDVDTGSKYNFVFGDQLGNLHLIVWHDQE